MHLVLTSILSISALPSEASQSYSDLLSKYVQKGRVDYAALAKHDVARLDQYLKAIAQAELPKHRNQRIALYVDAYNALVIRSVIRHGRPRSVLDIKGFFNNEKHSAFGRKLTLDELEKKVLNPFAKDPRTHFVLVCGAVGCPILESKPFLGSDMDKRMEQATLRYLKSPWGARVDGKTVRLSKIFDWYADDFGGPDGVRSFVAKRLEIDDGFRPAFIDYNWTLNQL